MKHDLTRMFPNASRSFLEANPLLFPLEAVGSEKGDNIILPPSIDDVWNSYLKHGSVFKVAPEFGVCGDTIRQWLKRAGKKLNKSKWTEVEKSTLREAYANPGGVSLALLASKLSRPYSGIAGMAVKMKLTSRRGKHVRTAETCAGISQRAIERIKRNGHPRGMLGKTHSEEVKRATSERFRGKTVPPDQVEKGMRTKVHRYGSLAKCAPRGSWKAAWREIGGRRIFARSRWEANYARYLEFLKTQGQISEWEHEPETFWFTEIKRGCRSYLPDFRVTLSTGNVEFHEVKGWMDDRSKTKLRRMKKYHPSVVLLVREKNWFKTNSPTLKGLIPGWEVA